MARSLMQINEALVLATRFLRELEVEVGFELSLKGEAQETSEGFEFYYDGKQMVENMDPQFALAGNAPILVKHDGTVGYLVVEPSRQTDSD